jgi:ribosomal-protein-alanine N-acetyltransferase
MLVSLNGIRVLPSTVSWLNQLCHNARMRRVIDYPFSTPPYLVTDRLIVRGLEPDDVQGIYRYMSQPDVTRYAIGGPHRQLSDSEHYVQSLTHAYKDNISGVWCIEKRDDRRLIGTAGFESWHPDHARGEIGYSIVPDLWRQGYMCEALKAVVKYAFETLGFNRLEAITHPENVGSGRLLEKLRFTREGLLRQYANTGLQFVDTDMYSLLYDDYCRYYPLPEAK